LFFFAIFDLFGLLVVNDFSFDYISDKGFLVSDPWNHLLTRR
jgi:hypothetical protein